MNRRRKIHLIFISNARQVAMCMLHVGANGFRFFLRINVKEWCEGEASTLDVPPP